MKNFIPVLWGMLLTIHMQAAYVSDSTNIYHSHEMNTNPLTGKRYFGTFKVNTLQVLFSEAPFTLEIFLRNDLSMQLQAGVIFPLESDSFLEQIFRSSGVNSTASPRGLLSYRNSPYNTNGLSFKYEIRKYTGIFYYAPQLMYKQCSYDKTVFPVFVGNRIMRQTETKDSRILGFGIMFGRQTYFLKQATDVYIGVGVRGRQTSATILKIEDPVIPHRVVLPGTDETSFRVYPFINFGFRLGMVF